MAGVRVEVVYALPTGEEAVSLELPAGATAEDALRASGLPQARNQKLGIYGRVVDPRTVLKEGDRVELYRPLLIDPKEARRRRARGKR